MEKFRNLFPQGKTKTESRIQIGKLSGSMWRKEELTEGQLNHHVQIVGASGYGKTVLISHIIKQRIEQGKGLLFIDLKADVETLLAFSQYAIQANRADDLQIFSLTDKNMSLPYNVIEDGTATQLRDRIINSLNWSEEYYKNQSSSFLLKLMILLCWLRDNKQKKFHLGTVLDCASNIKTLVEIGNEVPANESKLKLHAQSLKEFLELRENYNSLQGLRTQLESIVLSDFGELLATNASGINLFEAYNKSKIIFMFLDSRRYSESAKTVGRFILQDLKATSAKVDAEIAKSSRKPFSVVIDEFADLAQEDFIGFLDRARSSKMSVVVAHQELCDLQRISPEFAGRLMGNTSTLYAFLQKRPESAEIISGIAGTRTVWKLTKQTERFGFFTIESGGGSKREVEEFNIHPNQIKSLGIGTCVAVKKYPNARAYLVRVDAPE
jgi:type IV secretory pathway TraG/TraD family ATPase VirD4